MTKSETPDPVAESPQPSASSHLERPPVGSSRAIAIIALVVSVASVALSIWNARSIESSARTFQVLTEAHAELVEQNAEVSPILDYLLLEPGALAGNWRDAILDAYRKARIVYDRVEPHLPPGTSRTLEVSTTIEAGFRINHLKSKSTDTGFTVAGDVEEAVRLGVFVGMVTEMVRQEIQKHS